MPMLPILIVTPVLLLIAVLIFRRVGRDYQNHGQLTPISIVLETLIFFLHGCASYAYLDSSPKHINRSSPITYLAWALITLGVVLVAIAMRRLGMPKSLGRDVAGLQASGIYQYTRNPQIIAYTLVIVGYALLWPSWTGLLWIGLYFAIAHFMVRTEEAHLHRVYGQAYADYCQRTPRYLGTPKHGRPR